MLERTLPEVGAWPDETRCHFLDHYGCEGNRVIMGGFSGLCRSGGGSFRDVVVIHGR